MIMMGFLFCLGAFLFLVVLANLGLVLRLLFWGALAVVALVVALVVFH